MKKGPLSKKEKTFIQKCYSSTSVAELSSKMNRSENMISKYVATLASKSSEKKVVVSAEEQPQVKDISDLYARNQKYGATMMTETASVASDENKKAKVKMPQRTRNCIHRIKE
jgi:PIN domain nuclease of toxin-antitoxin system